MRGKVPDVELRPMDQNKDMGIVFTLLGMLHEGQSELFAEEGIELGLPGFDLHDYVVDMICVGGAPVGTILCRQSRHFADTFSISDLVIHPDWRGQGIGNEVLKIVLGRMKEDGVKFVNLNVHTGNEPAVDLYVKHGFRPKTAMMFKEL